MSAPEAAIQRAISDTLSAHGFLVIRVNSGLARALHGEGAVQLAPAGTPDLLAVPPSGAPWWLEVKTDAGRLRPAQTAMHEALRERGQTVHVVRSVDHLLRLLEVAGLSREA